MLHLLGKQEGLMLAFADGDWEGFYDKLNRIMPPFKKLPLFDQPTDDHKEIPAVWLLPAVGVGSPGS